MPSSKSWYSKQGSVLFQQDQIKLQNETHKAITLLLQKMDLDPIPMGLHLFEQ